MAQTGIERRSLAEQVFTHIKHLILSGELHGGERIPEERIAQELGVSRTPIREAFRRLEEYGLIVNEPHRAATVIEVDATEATKIAQVRAQLEILAVRLLAEQATEQDRAALQELADECKALLSNDIGAVFEKDSQLHLEIAARSGNPYLLELMERLDAKVQLCRLAKCFTGDTISSAVHQHDRIIAAIGAHDVAQAVKLIEEHALNTASIPVEA
jgi:DNA-binding GntR family transcriptional regulator